jgi:hypothetical protein
MKRIQIAVAIAACSIAATGVGYAAGSAHDFWLRPAFISRVQWLATQLNAGYAYQCPPYLGSDQHCIGWRYFADEKQGRIVVALETYGQVPLDDYDRVVDHVKSIAKNQAKGVFGREIGVDVQRLGSRGE